MRHQAWFKHIGSGQNIRTADLPFRLTKRAAHLFAQAPANLAIGAALRWSQVRALENTGGETSGSERLALAIAATRLGETFEDEPFWETVLHFFVNNPMLDISQVGPIVDYAAAQRAAYWNAVREAGYTVAPDGRRIPEFTMKGRTAPALLLRVDAWHRSLAREAQKPVHNWDGCGMCGFTLVEPDDYSGLPTRWQITEICDERTLAEEGKAMRHCVASYAASCARGTVSIWSLTARDVATQVTRRVMTIEVNNTRKVIVQARGRCNKLPGEKRASVRLDQAFRILRSWATQERLGIASHV